MKAAIIAGCVVLSVQCAAPGAQAYHEYRRCGGKVFLDINHAHATINGERKFWREILITEDPDGRSPSLNSFRCTDQNKCWLNGKLCRDMSYEEWHKEFPDAD